MAEPDEGNDSLLGRYDKIWEMCNCGLCREYLFKKQMSDAQMGDFPEKPPAHEPIQGKVAELRQELAGTGKKDKNHTAKKNALKKIVANMTMSNNDMVALFPDIVACMQLPVLEIKKM
jgi:vesicle coat complex subunit